jgi:hypothetical protein
MMRTTKEHNGERKRTQRNLELNSQVTGERICFLFTTYIRILYWKRNQSQDGASATN